MPLFDKVTIRGLFGRGTEEVIDFTEGSNYRILYGLNGSGKSTVLRLINAALKWDPLVLWQTEFESIEFITTHYENHSLGATDDSDEKMFAACESALNNELSELVEYGIMVNPRDTDGPGGWYNEPEFDSINEKKYIVSRIIDENGCPSITTTTEVKSSYCIEGTVPESNEKYHQVVLEMLPRLGAIMGLGDEYGEYVKLYSVDREYVETFEPPDSDLFDRNTLHTLALRMKDFFLMDITSNDEDDDFHSSIRSISNGNEIPFPYFASRYIPMEMMPEAEWRYRPATLSRYLRLPCVDKEGLLYPEEKFQFGNIGDTSNSLRFATYGFNKLIKDRRIIDWGWDELGEVVPFDELYSIEISNLSPLKTHESDIVFIRPDRLTSLLRDAGGGKNVDVLPSLDDTKGLLRLFSKIDSSMSKMIESMRKCNRELNELVLDQVQEDGCKSIDVFYRHEDAGEEEYDWSIPIEAEIAMRELSHDWEFTSPFFHDFHQTLLQIVTIAETGEEPILEVIADEWLDAGDIKLDTWGDLDRICEEIFYFEKISNLSKILEERMDGKKFGVALDGGLFVIDEEGQRIELQHLSSGERHLLTMFLYLIIEVNDGSLILIDEPEISLHISWQRKFVQDLIDTFGSRHAGAVGGNLGSLNFTAIIATHSPSIIANHLDHSIELGIGDLDEGEW